MAAAAFAEWKHTGGDAAMKLELVEDALAAKYIVVEAVAS